MVANQATNRLGAQLVRTGALPGRMHRDTMVDSQGM